MASRYQRARLLCQRYRARPACSAPSAAVSGLGGSTTYYWRANAGNAGGTGVWSVIWSFTTVVGAPVAPTLALPTNGAANQALSLTLSWGAVTNAASYEVQIAASSTFASTISDQTGLTTASASVSGLSNSTMYYWHANATDAGGTSAWSGIWHFATIIATPAAPTLTTPTNGASGQATLLAMSWGAVTGAASYSVLVSTVSTFASTISSQTGLTAVSASISGLRNSTAYYWEVNATNVGGTSAWSGIWSFTTVVAAPGAPVLSSPTNGAIGLSNALTLSWGTVSTAASYGVQVSTGSTFVSTVSSQTGLSAPSAAVSGLGGSTTYYWRANAGNAGGTGVWSGVWSFTTLVGAPAAPTLALPANGATGQATSLTVSWGAVSGAASYALQVATASTFATTVLSQGGVTATSFALGGLSLNLTYYWRANATNAGGTSSWSGVWSFSTGVNLAIPLVASWNMKSLNIHSTDSTTGGVFKGLKGFILAKNAAGQQYIPSDGIDQIDTIRTGMGYQIYDDSTDTIRVTGSPVNVALSPISLDSATWNIIAYLPQVNMLITTALAGISPQVVLVKNNAGGQYIPSVGVNTIDSMVVGEGYWIYTSAAATLVYPSAAKRVGGFTALLSLPDPRYYAKHRITGNNASFISHHIDIAGRVAADKCEVGAFDTKGNLVGAGTVVNGLTAFVIWGKDPMTRAKDGCDLAETISFRLWDGRKERPLVVTSGGDPTYGVNKILIASLAVPLGASISSFDLSRVYPNPFRGSVRIAFDVPAMGGTADQEVEIGVYDMKGCLVASLIKGRYAAGSYAVSWTCRPLAGGSASGSSIYILRMKANGFDKRVKLIELR